MKLKVENGKLVRRVDSIKNENQNIAWIEQEKDGLKQTVAQMKATIDNLQKTQAKQVFFFMHLFMNFVVFLSLFFKEMMLLKDMILLIFCSSEVLVFAFI